MAGRERGEQEGGTGVVKPGWHLSHKEAKIWKGLHMDSKIKVGAGRSSSRGSNAGLAASGLDSLLKGLAKARPGLRISQEWGRSPTAYEASSRAGAASLSPPLPHLAHLLIPFTPAHPVQSACLSGNPGSTPLGSSVTLGKSLNLLGLNCLSHKWMKILVPLRWLW